MECGVASSSSTLKLAEYGSAVPEPKVEGEDSLMVSEQR